MAVGCWPPCRGCPTRQASAADITTGQRVRAWLRSAAGPTSARHVAGRRLCWLRWGWRKGAAVGRGACRSAVRQECIWAQVAAGPSCLQRSHSFRPARPSAGGRGLAIALLATRCSCAAGFRASIRRLLLAWSAVLHCCRCGLAAQPALAGTQSEEGQHGQHNCKPGRWVCWS